MLDKRSARKLVGRIVRMECQARDEGTNRPEGLEWVRGYLAAMRECGMIDLAESDALDTYMRGAEQPDHLEAIAWSFIYS